MITHKKEFGIYYWDTFDNDTSLVGEADTLQEACDKVMDKYGKDIAADGADSVDIVNKEGDIVMQYPIG